VIYDILLFFNKPHRWCNGLASSAVYRGVEPPVGSNQICSKTMRLVFVASPLSSQH